MPLLDHAFHNAWATYLSASLNRSLPEGFFAEANVQFGVEVDVATFEEAGVTGGGDVVYTGGWTPTAPTQTLPLPTITDVVEALVYDGREGPRLAGAVELVSPANKDRQEHRDAFLAKVQSYLQQGVGAVVVDIGADRKANLHVELLQRLNAPSNGSQGLYAAAYRPAGRNGQTQLEVWLETLAIGGALPTLPLFLRGGACLSLELEATYRRTCEEQRVGGD